MTTALAASQAQGALEHQQQQQQQIDAYLQAMQQQQQAENFRSESLMRPQTSWSPTTG